LSYFLNAVSRSEKLGVRMAVHPDDHRFRIWLPEIVSNLSGD